MRYRPEGYVDGLAKGQVQLEDPDLNAYYAKLASIVQSPRLFTLERLQTILRFNLGAYDALLEHFVREKIRRKQVLPDATRRSLYPGSSAWPFQWRRVPPWPTNQTSFGALPQADQSAPSPGWSTLDHFVPS
jgi:hypothetical protein